MQFALCAFIVENTSKVTYANFYRAMHYVHSAVLRSHDVRLSVRLSACDVGGL